MLVALVLILSMSVAVLGYDPGGEPVPSGYDEPTHHVVSNQFEPMIMAAFDPGGGDLPPSCCPND